MPRSPGTPKSGGRTKGTPNRKTAALQATLEALGCDVPEKLVQILPQLDPDKQADVLLELMDFLYPKRKAVEVSGPDGSALQVEDRRRELQAINSDPSLREAAKQIAEGLATDES